MRLRRVSVAMARAGGRYHSIGVFNGVDLEHPDGLARALEEVHRLRPRHVWVSAPAGG